MSLLFLWESYLNPAMFATGLQGEVYHSFLVKILAVCGHNSPYLMSGGLCIYITLVLLHPKSELSLCPLFCFISNSSAGLFSVF